MVRESTLIYETAPPLPFICSNTVGIERGAQLTLSDPMTAALATDSTAACAGIAAEEKIASDGKTKLPVYREGIFKVTASGSITVGDAVAFQDNYACSCIINHEHIAGYALETATNSETFLMELRPGHRNLA